MRLNIVAGSFGTVFASILSLTYVTGYALTLGANSLQIGLITTVSLVCHVFQLLSVAIVERLGSRKRFWVPTIMIQRAIWVVPAALPFLLAGNNRAILVGFFGVVFVSGLLAKACVAPWWSWMGDLIPERIRGGFFGRRMWWLLLVQLGTFLVVGPFLDAFGEDRKLLGFAVIFVVAAVFGVIDIIVHSFIPEPPVRRRPRQGPALKSILAPLANPDFRRLTVGYIFFAFAMQIMSPFVVPFLIDKKDPASLGLTYTAVTAMQVLQIVVMMSISRPAGMLADRIGNRRVYILACGGILLPILGYLLVTSRNWFLMLPIIFSASGIMSVAQQISFGNLQFQLCSEQERPGYIALFWSIAGPIMALAPLVGGGLMEFLKRNPTVRIGSLSIDHYRCVFLLSAALGAAGIPFLLRIKAGKGRIRVSTWRLFRTNLVRTLGQINVLVSSGRAQRKVDAIRSLGQSKAELAVPELVDTLDDPHPVVRAEAATSLGKIRAGQAVDALLAKLEDNDADISTEAAEALGTIGDTRAFEALVTHLGSQNPQVRLACAGALARLGDQRALAPLEQMAAVETNPRVFVAAIKAQVSLGRRNAIWDGLRRMLEVNRPLFRQSVAMAVGDFVAPAGRFYRAFSAEKRVPGQAASGLGRRLRRWVMPLLAATDPAEARRIRKVLRNVVEAFEDGQFNEVGMGLQTVALAALHALEQPQAGRLARAGQEEMRTQLTWRLHFLIELNAEAAERPVTLEEALVGLFLMSWCGGPSGSPETM